MARISLATTKTIVFSETYKDFEDNFLVENTNHLFLHKDYDYTINLINGKQPFYGLIYSLSKNKLSIL